LTGRTDHAAGSLNGLGLTIELIAKTFDIVQAVGDDNVVAGKHPLYGRILFRAGVLLSLGGMVYPTGHAKRLIVDEVNLELAGPGIGALAGDLGLEEILQLEGARGLARRGISRDDQKLCRYQRTCACACTTRGWRCAGLTGMAAR
jgi:hypothetical protein